MSVKSQFAMLDVLLYALICVLLHVLLYVLLDVLLYVLLLLHGFHGFHGHLTRPERFHPRFNFAAALILAILQLRVAFPSQNA